MKYLVMPIRRFADFSGRSRRKEYWIFTFPLVGAVTLMVVLMGAAGLGNQAELSDTMSKLTIGTLLLTAIPALALSVRRLHDQNRSGWLILIALAPIMSTIAFDTMIGEQSVLRNLPLIGGIVLLVMMSLKGSVGSNRYGEDPRL